MTGRLQRYKFSKAVQKRSQVIFPWLRWSCLINMPLGLILFFSSLVIWIGLLVVGFKRRAFGPFIVFGIVFLLIMNVRYLIEGAPAAIAFFIGIYDLLDNLGLRPGEGAAALSTCPNNICTVWGNTYLTAHLGARPSTPVF